jgi:hypothetical protein
LKSKLDFRERQRKHCAYGRAGENEQGEQTLLLIFNALLNAWNNAQGRLILPVRMRETLEEHTVPKHNGHARQGPDPIQAGKVQLRHNVSNLAWLPNYAV